MKIHRFKQGFTHGRFSKLIALFIGFAIGSAGFPVVHADQPLIAQSPLFWGGGVDAPPLTMLVMGKDHTLYYEAYNDASDLSGDGVLDVGYKPAMVDDKGKPVNYFGYFDSYLCYDYDSDNGRFKPVAKTPTKKCSVEEGDYWSGDYLNYLTTSRIDALRKVLYGGKRYIDNAFVPTKPEEVTTVLERSYIPQDAHSWGKEYKDEAHDGYKITDYTPLLQPSTGTRHLFANTTLANTTDKNPRLRVLQNSRFRIWQWVAIEMPVADSQCVEGVTKQNCVTTATTVQGSHPNDPAAFQTLIDTWGTDAQKCGSGAISGWKIDTSGSNNNPFTPSPDPFNCGTDDYYISVIRGQIYASDAGDYTFATNGDDAVEVLIDGAVAAYWLGDHGAISGSTAAEKATNIDAHGKPNLLSTIRLNQGWHDIEFRHEDASGGDNWQLLWKPPGGEWSVVPSGQNYFRKSATETNVAPTITTYKQQRPVSPSTITDYTVRVEVCKKVGLRDSNCQPYIDTVPETDIETWKPDGLLQKYGKDDRMYFGLMSGAFTHPYNMRGGVLRKNIESFMNKVTPNLGEVNPSTGVFTDFLGIVKTIDKFRIVDFKKGDSYHYRSGLLTDKSMVNSDMKFPDWGNPIGEMMYESLRYFSGKTKPTIMFMPALNANENEEVELLDFAGTATEDKMELPAPDWIDPYTRGKNLYCSPGAQLVISDVNPSYDTESVPGSVFNSYTDDIEQFDVNAATEADAIWQAEHGASSLHFIGQVGDLYDGAPTGKTVSGLGNIRGLSPSEPTKQGGYYSAGIARYAFNNDLRTDLKDRQDINTFSVAIASPLPKIEIPVGTETNKKIITFVPFGKTVIGGSMSRAKRDFQATNTIVDFFIENFANTAADGSDSDPINGGRAYIRFRVNFEDVEQGNDHDMDAMVVYTLKANADDTLTVDIAQEYEGAGYTMNYGYVITGTTKDGIYLDISSQNNPKNPVYYLNTPSGHDPGYCDTTTPPADCDELPTAAPTRIFTPSGDNVATVLENPLWYAAKYGSEGNEKLAKGEPSPNYFLVTNAGKLQEQLEEAFARIIKLGEATASAISITSTRVSTDTVAYEASFDDKDWSGVVLASKVNTQDGTLDKEHPVWSTDYDDTFPDPDKRKIFTLNPGTLGTNPTPPTGIPFDWDKLAESQKILLGTDATMQQKVLNWVRGDRTAEGVGTNDLRVRNKLLGDIVNSNPLYVGKPKDYGYGDLPEGTPGQDNYDEFLETNLDRTPMLYVGANDGMLHAFDAATGKEQFAYLPNAAFPKLKSLTEQSYTEAISGHRYLVDGSPNIGEAYFADNTWHSVLIGTLAAGGKAIFGLDVTDPDTFDRTDVLWEFTDTELGYQVAQMSPQPTIGRMRDGQWAVVFGNGYDSGYGAWLYIVNLETGALINKIQASDDVANGLSGVALSFDSNRNVVAAYAGDLKGQLWKFDLLSSNPAQWEVALNGLALFTATDDAGLPQPITGPVNVGDHPLGGKIVVFGTGQYMRDIDPAIKDLQTAYGIWDTEKLTDEGKWGDDGSVALKDKLVAQEFLYEDNIENKKTGKTKTWRVLSRNAMNWGTLEKPQKRGWFLHLKSPNASPDPGEHGERVLSQPTIMPGTNEVLFTSIVPTASDDPCVAGKAYRWIFLVDLITGGTSDWTRFDVNGDGVFNIDDVKKITEDEDGDGDLEEVLKTYIGFKDDFGGAATAVGTGGSDAIIGTGATINRGPPRQSWRQLR